MRDPDIEHAINNRIREKELDGERPVRVLYLGPDRAGNLLEVVTIERDDMSELAIHAMKMTDQYQPLLNGLEIDDE